MTNFSQDVAESLVPYVDRAGHEHLHKLPVTTWLTTIAGTEAAKTMFEAGREVPDNFWSEDARDGDSVALIACPCGSTPEVEAGLLRSCDGCDRTYWYQGTRVVAYRPPGRRRRLAPPGRQGCPGVN